MFALKNKRVLLCGGSGFLGSNIFELLSSKGVLQVRVPRSEKTDLRIWENCQKVVKNIDLVIHAAGNVGGIGYNRKNPATLYEDNLLMGTLLMKAAREGGVKKFVNIGTICSYPKFTKVPFKESDLWSGYPEETNAPYGLAKKMLIVQAQAYRDQFGFNAINLLPVNMYGPKDNFIPTKAHVIPDLIMRIAEAKKKKSKSITAWGTGQATREFLYVVDAAEAIIMATEKYDKSEPVNIGSGKEISIKDLAKLICELMDYKGAILWDKSKPDGQLRRCLDVDKAYEEFGFKAKTSFREGLKKSIDWYLDNIKPT